MYDIIYKKREGKELSEDEIKFFVREYTKGNIPDYQASALLMAIFFRKMNNIETYFLTKAMIDSGTTVDLSKIDGIKVDKHSTGGVGDTTTLIVGPIVASCGVPVAKMSGRGLGHTGGTIDKLESIPGFCVEMAVKQFVETINRVKIAVIGQSFDLAPADKKLYALRDVTATVENISLIASSIMSKKLAAGANAIVLDVKFGSGAFMKSLDETLELAKTMVNIGTSANRETIALLTNMDQPLGYAVGNALEVKEAIDILNYKGPEDLRQLCIYLASYMVLLAKRVETIQEAFDMVCEKLISGEALKKFKEFVYSQGGDVSIIEDKNKLPHAKYVEEVKVEIEGYVEHIKADDIGLAALILGAGRECKESLIDLSAGIVLKKKVGDPVKAKEVIAVIHTNDLGSINRARKIISESFIISKCFTHKPKIIHGIVSKNEIQIF
jgi:pyrimidine-nucleoside phosphorylase